MTIPFNNWFGRRGTIFLTCIISAIACIWQGFTNSWWHMFIARFVLGVGIGAKSATVPMVSSFSLPTISRFLRKSELEIRFKSSALHLQDFPRTCHESSCLWFIPYNTTLTYSKYAAECSPPAIRGALVMQWQMWSEYLLDMPRKDTN